MNSVKAFRGIIFDFNGVLWWDYRIQEISWKHFSKERRGVPFTENEMVKHVHGRTNKDTLEYLEKRKLKNEELDFLINKKERLYRQLCIKEGSNLRLSPGATDTLNNLVRLGVPRAIATSSEKRNIDFFVASFSLTNWFKKENIIYDNGKRPGKPAPDIYFEAANVLRLKPSECVVVEDSKPGVQSAFSAGIGYIVALATEMSVKKTALQAGAHTVIENLGQLTIEEYFT